MTLTTLDPRTALVVVDLQQGVVAGPTAHPIRDVVAHAAGLVHAFREHDLPVVLVTATGGPPGRTDAQQSAAPTAARPPDFADLVPELAPVDGDVLVTKQTWGSFTGTGLHEELQRRGVTQVVVLGVATSIGVESTARAAHELGYHVSVVTDAVTDRVEDSHRHSLERILPRLGETGTTADVLDLLARR